MAGRYLERNEEASSRAVKNNLWIRYNKAWFTPEEFYQKFGSGHQIKDKKPIRLLNPMLALREGRKVIEQMIIDKKPASAVLNAIDRLNKFTDKIIKEQYKEQEKQKNEVRWPDEPEPVTEIGDRVKRL